jgi:predicted MFS family arabinose efflux permease
LGVVVFVGVALVVEESPSRTADSLDLTGGGLLGVGLVALLLALSKGSDWGWSSAKICVLFVVSAVALTAFAAVERRVEAPLVDLQLVVRKPFVSTNLCAVTFGFAFFSATYILPLIAATPPRSGYGLGLSTTRIGLLLAATSIASLAAAWGGGRVVDRIGSRLLAMAGACFGLVGYCVLAASHSSATALAVGTATVAVGAGLIPTATLSVVLRNARSDKTGVAPAVTLLFRGLGLSVGLTVTFAVISGAGLDGLFRNEVGFTRAYLVGAAGAVFALLAALFLPGRRSTFRADALRSDDRKHDPTRQTLSPG